MPRRSDAIAFLPVATLLVLAAVSGFADGASIVSKPSYSSAADGPALDQANGALVILCQFAAVHLIGLGCEHSLQPNPHGSARGSHRVSADTSPAPALSP